MLKSLRLRQERKKGSTEHHASKEWRRFLFGLYVWQPLTDVFTKATNWPLIGKRVGRLHNKKHYDVTFIPINKELEKDDSTVLPRQIVEEMIKKSSARMILPVCLCRTGCRCKDYPMGLGCLFLGEATKKADPSMGKQVSVEEALEHMNKAIDAGLIPQIGRVDADPFMLRIKSEHWRRFLTLCFCCPCCCIAMRNMDSWSPEIKELMHGLEGLTIEISDECNGCGTCVENCFAHAMKMHRDRAYIDFNACKGCGICAEKCPQDAISIRVDDGNNMLEEAFKRLETCGDVT